MDDIQAFEAFMSNYQNMVFSTAMRLVANAAEAEDIAQETFLKAYAHFGALRENPAAGGWLKTVATNLSLNHLARYRSRWSFFSELVSGRETDETMELNLPASDEFDARLLEQDRGRMLETALQKLSAAQRVPLVLFHLDGLGYEEIAAKLGVSLGKVKTDIHRGRAALRRQLESQRESARELI